MADSLKWKTTSVRCVTVVRFFCAIYTIDSVKVATNVYLFSRENYHSIYPNYSLLKSISR